MVGWSVLAVPDWMMTLAIRQAGPEDVDAIAALWTRASKWLGSIGTDQWQYPVRVEGIQAEVAVGDVWVVSAIDGDGLVGSVTIEDADGSGLWDATDCPDRALYVHRLVVDRDAGLTGLGSAILDWAGRRAQRLGRPYLRLDAWTSNTRLHEYYLDRGFRHVRTVYGPDVLSGALFERPAARRLGWGPALEEVPGRRPA